MAHNKGIKKGWIKTHFYCDERCFQRQVYATQPLVAGSKINSCYYTKIFFQGTLFCTLTCCYESILYRCVRFGVSYEFGDYRIIPENTSVQSPQVVVLRPSDEHERAPVDKDRVVSFSRMNVFLTLNKYWHERVSFLYFVFSQSNSFFSFLRGLQALWHKSSIGQAE